MAAQWPLVVDRLVALLPTLPGWSGVSVYDGPPVTGAQPKQYVTVGYVSDDNGGTYSTQQNTDGFRYDEQGVVACNLVCNTGSNDVSGARGQVFVLMDAVEAAIRADRRLGVLSPEGAAALVVDVHTASNQRGTAQSLVFQITYTTTT